jgi:hypothetical protein
MTTNNTAPDVESFVIPSRTLRGSKREMLEDIDQAIVSLLAFRHMIDGTAPPLDALASRGLRRQGRRRWPRFLAGLGLPGFGS